MRAAIAYIKGRFSEQRLIGAEVGVGKGDHALDMIKGLVLEKLILVDHWQGYFEDGRLILSFTGLDEQVKERFKSHNFVEIVTQASPAVASLFKDGYFDFVYIDACPCFDCVYQDIIAWRPKVKPGGILAGHDYHWEATRKAVNQIFSDKELIIKDIDWLVELG